jgi:hypothetical protein
MVVLREPLRTLGPHADSRDQHTGKSAAGVSRRILARLSGIRTLVQYMSGDVRPKLAEGIRERIPSDRVGIFLGDRTGGIG